MTRTWREYCAPIIHRVITEVGTADEPKLRAALREAYPFGERKHHPYKIWLDEVHRQLVFHRVMSAIRKAKAPSPDGQGELFA